MDYGDLTTGAGIASQFNEPNTEASIVVGTIDTDVPLRGLTITVAGAVNIALTGILHIQAFAKLLMGALLGADVKVPMRIPVASAFMPGQSVSINMINDGATTPEVRGYSRGKTDALPVLAGQETINASSSQKYGADFDFLIVPQTNFDFAMVDFADGFTDRFTVVELAALFAETHATDADGMLATQIMIDNSNNQLRGVTVYSDGGGELTISKVNMG